MTGAAIDAVGEGARKNGILQDLCEKDAGKKSVAGLVFAVWETDLGIREDLKSAEKSSEKPKRERKLRGTV